MNSKERFIIQFGRYFKAHTIDLVVDSLNKRSDENAIVGISASLRNPDTIQIVSVFLGALGVDRFMLGDIGIGILKLLTGGVFGILTIIDWFKIRGLTQDRNMKVFMSSIEMYPIESNSTRINDTNSLKEGVSGVVADDPTTSAKDDEFVIKEADLSDEEILQLLKEE
jgi:TM2 domain-containing membrane protein YozV